jgi:hypothetical protein
MNERIKNIWVSALLSGTYKQGKAWLKDGDSFCCLGVLCDLHSKETGTEWDGEAYLGRMGFLPIEVQEWSGISSHRAEFCKELPGDSLQRQNDCGATFHEIVELIKEHF